MAHCVPEVCSKWDDREHELAVKLNSTREEITRYLLTEEYEFFPIASGGQKFPVKSP